MIDFPAVPGAERLPDDQKKQLLELALARVTRSARPAAPLILGWWGAMALFTEYPEEHPWIFWSFFAAFFALLTASLAINPWLRERSSWPLIVRIRVVSAAFILSSILLSSYSLTTHYYYGDNWITMQAYMLLAFTAVGTLFSYSSMLKTSAFHCFILMTPGMAGYFFIEAPSARFIGVGSFLFLLFNLPQLVQIHKEYWFHAVHARLRDLEAAELARAKDSAEQASTAKSALLATVSHELRTPLSGMLGTSALVLEMPMTPEVRGHVDNLQRSARGLLALVDDLLAAARLEAGRMQFRMAPYAPRSVADEVAGLFTAIALERELDLNVRVAPEVPARVLGDVGRIQQVLANLVTNALKFTERGRVEIQLARVYEAHEEFLEFAVEDTGVGIPAAQQEHIFQRFSQADPSFFLRYGGSGLGLAIARELVMAMGGTLGFTSEEGKGARFFFRLPYREAGAAPELPDPPVEAAETGDAPRAGLRVLVADDDAVLRKVVRLMLQRLGCTVFEAVDGDEAVAVAARERCDLILMDCQMPTLSGVVATERILADWGRMPSVPILAMTANTDGDVHARCLSAGMSDVLVKPITDATLRTVLTRWGARDAAAALPRPGDA